MTYNPGIPLSTDLLSTSQGEIKTNFTQLNSQFGIDHIPYKNGGINGTGYHKQVTFSGVEADPGQTAPICTLYTKLVSGTPQLFFQNGAAPTNSEQLTGPSTVAASGSVTIQAGIIIKWGHFGGTGNNGPVPFVSPFPNNCFSVVITTDSLSSANKLGVSTPTVSQFLLTVSPSINIASGYYIAIGN